jgi:REP element-mobilizing transposase RayT
MNKTVGLERHRRRSIRWKGYDYTQAGAYFITVVTQLRTSLFGDIRAGEMVPRDAGRMVERWWRELPSKFPAISGDVFVVMPNHVHGIIVIRETVGADQRVRPVHAGAHAGAPLQGNPSLSQIIQWFKSMTTNEYIRGVHDLSWPPFHRRLWQRNYYEHVIRDERERNDIYLYINANPANWQSDDEYPSPA